MIPDEKRCNGCGEVKPADAFYPRRQRGKVYLQSHCKACTKERWAAATKAARETPEGLERCRASIRNSMRKRSLAAVGIDEEQYQRMYATQAGCCLICEEPHDRLCVDHDHETGRVRGLLCHGCNVALGNFKDDPARILRAAQYIALQPYFATVGA